MKTIAVAAALAAEAADEVLSVVEVVIVVPSAEAWVLMASRGATRYCVTISEWKICMTMDSGSSNRKVCSSRSPALGLLVLKPFWSDFYEPWPKSQYCNSYQYKNSHRSD